MESEPISVSLKSDITVKYGKKLGTPLPSEFNWKYMDKFLSIIT